MAIIGHVESKSPRGRLTHAAIIVALTLGSLAMVYPFAIMVSGSLRSDMDATDLDLVPDFLRSESTLFRKFLETKYNIDARLMNRVTLAQYTSFREVEPPTHRDRADVETLRSFIARPDLPLHWQNLGGIAGVRSVPENLRELRERLDAEFDGDIQALGRDLGSPRASWVNIVLTAPEWMLRRYDYQRNALFNNYFDMVRESDAAERMLVSLSGLFLETMVYPEYGGSSTGEYNEAHTVKLDRYRDFRLPATMPGDDRPRLRAEWLEFVEKELNPSFIVVDGADQDEYDAFQSDLGIGEPHDLPDGGQWISGDARVVYMQYLETVADERLRLVGPEFALDGVSLPEVMPQLEYEYVLSNAGTLRWRYAVRNYINVFDELVLQGNALVNTFIYCTLSIVLALLLNPLAAYAMSRFKLPGTYKVLLVLMATMSFPPMVTMIPQFILLRKLHLLNTYAALIIPLVANGYMIFLLKGFFDSLPQELYEAARIDGAGEMRMFLQITMALSRPILAVLALGTFTASYTAFLYPLLVCPDEDMWLISVWLFQFQQRAGSAGVFAAVIIVSIPTMVMFLLTQRTIMRGIAVPTDK